MRIDSLNSLPDAPQVSNPTASDASRGVKHSVSPFNQGEIYV